MIIDNRIGCERVNVIALTTALAMGKEEEEEKKAEEQPQNKTEKKEEAEDESKEEPIIPHQPPQLQDIVLNVFMHCQGCARKVRRCLKGFQGVESVETDCRNHRVVVKGEKADPQKVLGRLQSKTHRRVELISPVPEPTAPNQQPLQNPKTEENKPERHVITLVLKVHMHCEACAQEIKRRIHRIRGVESVEPDLKSSQVTVKGAIEPAALVQYVHRRTGKHAAIVKQEPEIKPPENDSELEAAKEDKLEEKQEDAGEVGTESEKKVVHEETKVEEKTADAAVAATDGVAQKTGDPAAEEAMKVVEVKKNEYRCYPQRYIMEMYPYIPPPMIGEIGYPPRPHMVVDAYPPPVIGHAYPPQMFSDENPNACSVM